MFSAPGKRRVLEVLLIEHPGRTWTRRELAVATGQHAKARMDLYLNRLVELGIVEDQAGSYAVAADEALTQALHALLLELRRLPT